MTTPIESLLEKRFTGFFDEILLSKIVVTGPDALSFLQGQTTNCLKSLEINNCQYNSLLNRQGRIEFFFIINKISDEQFWIWIENQSVDNCLARLEKYIIADDVVLDKTAAEKYFVVCALSLKKQLHSAISSFRYYNEESYLFSQLPLELEKLPKITADEKNALFLSRGFFSLTTQTANPPLLNETIALEIAWNKQKGCFLGQEVVQKIYSRRGATTYPYMLQIFNLPLKNAITEINMEGRSLQVHGLVEKQKKIYAAVMLPREGHLDGLHLKISINQQEFEAQVEAIKITSELENDIYHHAIELYSLESKNEEAVDWLKNLIRYAPENPEYHEALGAIYGKLNRHEEAIAEMKIVAQLLPDEVMPYTNMSVYAMKLGKIEEAEKYKEEATIRSFLKFGEQAKLKKEKELAASLEKNKILEREKMFLDVLEIDEFDAMALCGLAEIDLLRLEPVAAQKKLEKLFTDNAKYTQAYTILGKCYQALGQNQKAQEIWKQGISLALSKGELMPAQLMQSYLQKNTP